MLSRAVLNIPSCGGSTTARFVFSVKRVMKNMKPLALICISAKFALPAGIPVCLLYRVSVSYAAGEEGRLTPSTAYASSVYC